MPNNETDPEKLFQVIKVQQGIIRNLNKEAEDHYQTLQHHHVVEAQVVALTAEVAALKTEVARLTRKEPVIPVQYRIQGDQK